MNFRLLGSAAALLLAATACASPFSEAQRARICSGESEDGSALVAASTGDVAAANAGAKLAQKIVGCD